MEAAGEISIPLARTTTREKMAMRHVLEPHLGLVWTPLLGTGGSTAAGLSTRPPLLLRGGFASAGLRTRLHSRKARDGSWMPLRRPLAGEVRLLWPLPGEGADEREPMLAGSLTLSLPPALHGKLRLLYRPESNSLAHLEGDLCLLTWGAFQPCAGYRRLRLTGAMELWAPDLPPRADTLLWLDSRADQVYGGLRLRLGPVRADVLLAVDPELRQFSHASAAMQLVLGCGCYRVGFQVATRAGQRWPDLGAQFTLQTPGAARCLGRRNSGGGPAR